MKRRHKIKSSQSPLQRRVQKARATLPFVKVNSTDIHNRPKDLFVPGTQAKTYNVIIKRNSDILVECFITPHNDAVRCKGSLNSVCYHAIGALIYSAELSGLKVAVCDTEHRAMTRSKLGGNIFKVISRRAIVDNPLWIVVSDPSEISTEEKIASISHE